MKDQIKRPSREIRKQHNADLLRRMRNGDSLTSFDSRSSWYPPRPTIEKDRGEIARVYNAAAPSDSRSARTTRNGKVEGLRVLTLTQPSSSQIHDDDALGAAS